MNISALSRTLPFLLFLLFLGLADLLVYFQHSGYGAFAAWDLRWLYPVKIAAVALVMFLLSKHYSELTHPSSVPFRQWLLAVITGVAVFVLWINLDHGWQKLGDAPGFNPGIEGGEGGIDWRLAGARLLGATLIVPVMEELFWRSFIMRWIDRQDFLSVEPAKTSTKALLLTAVLFGFGHHLWLAGIVAGLAYGWLYKRCNTIWAPIGAHAVTNGLLGIWVLQTGHWEFW